MPEFAWALVFIKIIPVVVFFLFFFFFSLKMPPWQNYSQRYYFLLEDVGTQSWNLLFRSFLSNLFPFPFISAFLLETNGVETGNITIKKFKCFCLAPAWPSPEFCHLEWDLSYWLLSYSTYFRHLSWINFPLAAEDS